MPGEAVKWNAFLHYNIDFGWETVKIQVYVHPRGSGPKDLDNIYDVT